MTTSIPNAPEVCANEDTHSPTQSRVRSGPQSRRNSQRAEHTGRIQLSKRMSTDEVTKMTYQFERQAADGKPGVQRMEVRKRTMSLKLEGPAGTAVSTVVTSSTRPTSPTQRQHRRCESCKLPVLEERSNSLPSFVSTMEQQGMSDRAPLITPRTSSPSPSPSQKGSRILACIPFNSVKLGWLPSKFFKRKAKTTDCSPSAGNDVNKRTAPTKAASEGSVMNEAIAPPNNNHMSTIMEDEVVESPTNTEQTPLSRTTSLEPTCLCKRVINNIRRPNVISISSCSDGQTTYEGPDGLSVTQTLIKILEKDPHPTYDHLMKEMRSGFLSSRK